MVTKIWQKSSRFKAKIQLIYSKNMVEIVITWPKYGKNTGKNITKFKITICSKMIKYSLWQ